MGVEAAKKAGVEIVDLAPTEKAKWMSRIKHLPLEQAHALDARGLKGTATFETYFRILREEGYTFPVPYSGF
jgi:hypothetical protein